MGEVFALVDCNNFYVSCERIFRPDLKERPVVVLSNNDGNVVSLSNEAKTLGIPFGAPFFKLAELIAEEGVAVFSSNYTLYGDMSRRVMDTLSSFSPDMEIYSIDEAFLALRGGTDAVTGRGRDIRETVMRWTGIPVSIGIAPTKTLAKLASKVVKKDSSLGGLLNITGHPHLQEILGHLDVEAVWGVGPRYGGMLRSAGFRTVRDLMLAPDHWVRKKMHVTGLRTVMELRGISCLALEDAAPPKKGIVCSRSFGRPVSSLEELQEAVASYAARGAEKLRGQGSAASFLTVFIATNRFVPEDPQYSNGVTVPLPVPSSYTPLMIRTALQLLERIYRPGFRYKKAGVMFSGIVPQWDRQLDLFRPVRESERQQRLMRVMDGVNRGMGRDTLYFASQGVTRAWGMRRAYLSRRYTTRWNELPVVRAI
ncbi:MAG: Y-family DNA polymerase [Spirochaetes bacterium]|nr:Y-family DNA polymerase [Spirochaetota bacterium]